MQYQYFTHGVQTNKRSWRNLSREIDKKKQDRQRKKQLWCEKRNDEQVVKDKAYENQQELQQLQQRKEVERYNHSSSVFNDTVFSYIYVNSKLPTASGIEEENLNCKIGAEHRFAPVV